MARAACGMAALALLAGCGDDLESRQQAVEERQPVGGEVTIGDPAPRASRTASTPGPAATTQGFEDEDPGEELVVDAEPEIFIDDAQGFSTDPIDDTSGFDPTPPESGGFAPEPMAPESFED